MTPSADLNGQPPALPSSSSARDHGKRAPRAHWSDLWLAPVHDFPIRDEILYQWLPLGASSDVLEIGPGSGFTAFRLARRVRRLTLLDVAQETVEALRQDLRLLQHITFACDDVTQPGLADRLDGRFDAAFGLDVFEYVADPATCLLNLAAVLRPGGELLLTYPNMPPPVGDGVTYFSRPEALADLLAKAGFRDWRISTLRLRTWARVSYGLLHEGPLAFYRRLHRRDAHARPQTYESTWAFKHGRRLARYKVPLHLLWMGLGWTIRLCGPPFVESPVVDSILGHQLLVRAWR